MPNVVINGMPIALTQGQDGNFELETAQGGLGGLQSVPAGTANGTALGIMPVGAIGARIYLAAADSLTITIASSQPASPPGAKVTISGSSTPNWDENLSGGEMIYVVGAVTGAPLFRWI